MKIALVGKMRSGKDTVASLLIPYGFQTIAFGDGIKEIVADYFPEALQAGKPREHYQKIGQWLRELNSDVWINAVARRSKDFTHTLVTDCRQKNEVRYLKSNGYMILKVHASESVRIKRIIASSDSFTPEVLQHSTEVEVDSLDFDCMVTNNGTREELVNEVKYAYKFYQQYFEPDFRYRKLLEVSRHDKG